MLWSGTKNFVDMDEELCWYEALSAVKHKADIIK